MAVATQITLIICGTIIALVILDKLNKNKGGQK